jgi:hypothetical protein
MVPQGGRAGKCPSKDLSGRIIVDGRDSSQKRGENDYKPEIFFRCKAHLNDADMVIGPDSKQPLKVLLLQTGHLQDMVD